MEYLDPAQVDKRKNTSVSEKLEILIGERDIAQKVKEMAAKISSDYAGRHLSIVFISNGAIIFAADLIRSIEIPLRIDSIRTSSYSGEFSTGNVKIMSQVKLDIKDRNILVVDDIIDTGRTIVQVVAHLSSFAPSDIKTCALLDKPSRREVPFVPDYIGFEIPDLFVVGYGLDLDEYYRNLPHIAVIKT